MTKLCYELLFFFSHIHVLHKRKYSISHVNITAQGFEWTSPFLAQTSYHCNTRWLCNDDNFQSCEIARKIIHMKHPFCDRFSTSWDFKNLQHVACPWDNVHNRSQKGEFHMNHCRTASYRSLQIVLQVVPCNVSFKQAQEYCATCLPSYTFSWKVSLWNIAHAPAWCSKY